MVVSATATSTRSETYAVLPRRGVLGIGGADAREFLQNLLSNDVRRLSQNAALYALLLTPQGKYLHDFFLAEHSDRPAGTMLLLDGEGERLADLVRRLTLYKLRSDVTLVDLSDRYAVAVAFGADTARKLALDQHLGSARAFAGGVAFVDPRLTDLGVRIIAPADSVARALGDAGFALSAEDMYDALRLRHGIPDSSRDLVVDKTLPLEAGLDALHAIDYGKGCYVGQELTARTHYRGTIRKRLMPVTIDGPAPAFGTPVMLGARDVGEMRSTSGHLGIALLRVEYVDEAERTGGTLTADSAKLRAARPAWFAPEGQAAGQSP